MITQFIHIIGPQASGKSRLADALAAQASSENRRCIVINEPGALNRQEFAQLKVASERTTPYQYREPYQRAAVTADLVIVEHPQRPLTTLIAPGHQIIRLQQVLA